MSTQSRFLSGESVVVDGVTFVCDYRLDSTPERFNIVKELAHVRWYLDLLENWQAASMFELGIAEGGSTALAAVAARPRKLVSVDMANGPLPALQEFIRRRGLDDVVRPYWGVDQADGTRLAQIVDAEFGSSGLDVVIDDASHELVPTRSSFDTLFPHLRPGGLFLIEDWTYYHLLYDAVVATRGALPGEVVDEVTRLPIDDPLSRLAIELLLACASSPAIVEEVTMTEYAIVVRRGPGAVDASSFRLGDLYVDHFGLDVGRA